MLISTIEGSGLPHSPSHYPFHVPVCWVSGTPSQIEWAEQIKPRVSAEFDRVAKALMTAASSGRDQARTDVHAIIAILEEKRSEVMAQDKAGYFIRNWQELRDQVRDMIGQDPRYQKIKASRKKVLL